MATAQDADPWAQFEAESKDPSTAILFEAFFPFLGGSNAGDWRASIRPFAVEVAGYTTMIVDATIEYNCETVYGFEFCDKGIDAVFYVGLAAAVGGFAWRLLSAHKSAQEFNQNLRERLGIALIDVDLNIRPAPGPCLSRCQFLLGGRR